MDIVNASLLTGSKWSMGFSALATTVETEVPSSRRPLRVIGVDLGTTTQRLPRSSCGSRSIVCPKHAVSMSNSLRGKGCSSTRSCRRSWRFDGQLYVGAGRRICARASATSSWSGTGAFLGLQERHRCSQDLPRAPAGFGSAKEIAGQLLRFLMDSASGGDSPPADATVATVPASFQAAKGVARSCWCLAAGRRPYPPDPAPVLSSNSHRSSITHPPQRGRRAVQT